MKVVKKSEPEMRDKPVGNSELTESLLEKNEKLRRSEEKYHKMMSEIEGYAILLLDTEGNVLDWNKGAEKVKGYKSAEIIGKNFRLFYPREDIEAGLPKMLLSEAALNGSAVREGWRLRKDGSRFWASVIMTALFDDDKKLIAYTKITKDLTEQKIAQDHLDIVTEELRQANESLRKSEERYHQMIAEVQDYAIILLDSDGIIQNWNAGAEYIKGYKEYEIVGKSFKHFYTKEDQERGLPDSLLSNAVAKGRTISEGWRVRKDGSMFWGSVVITALHNPEGEIIGFSKVTRDLTLKKLADDQLKKSALELEAKNTILERLNGELSSYAYVVSHDLKEPIRKIQVFASRQKEPGRTPEQVLEFSEKIAQNAARMQRLMEDLLSYSRLTQDDQLFGKVDLNAVISNICSDLEILVSDSNARIITSDLPVIRGIPFQVQQLFQNLLINAIKFAKEGEPPVIEIRSREVSGSELGFTLEAMDKRYHEISVKDNGIGFDRQYAEKMFEVFQRLQSRTPTSGSGIGLAIVRRIISNHEGFVRAESEEGQGATFRVYFPL